VTSFPQKRRKKLPEVFLILMTRADIGPGKRGMCFIKSSE